MAQSKFQGFLAALTAAQAPAAPPADQTAEVRQVSAHMHQLLNSIKALSDDGKAWLDEYVAEHVGGLSDVLEAKVKAAQDAAEAASTVLGPIADEVRAQLAPLHSKIDQALAVLTAPAAPAPPPPAEKK